MVEKIHTVCLEFCAFMKFKGNSLFQQYDQNIPSVILKIIFVPIFHRYIRTFQESNFVLISILICVLSIQFFKYLKI